jgi:hypothetical protein
MGNFFQQFWTKVAAVLGWFADLVETAAAWVIDKLIDLLVAAVDLVQSALDWFFGLLGDVMPEGLQSAWGDLAPYFGVVRAWFPVDYLALLMGILFGVQGLVVGFKFFLKVKQLVNPFG